MKQISRSVANETHGTTTQVAISFLYSSWATFAGDHPSLVTLRSRCSSPARSSCYGPASGPLSPVLYLSHVGPLFFCFLAAATTVPTSPASNIFCYSSVLLPRVKRRSLCRDIKRSIPLRQLCSHSTDTLQPKQVALLSPVASDSSSTPVAS
ncbi:hypothetical protein BHE74_00008125 [Ensete ventricosum]|nr:hypothetical protein GW17_00024603 [Ensete ventricosum]RWW83362.1 hypothetical protein BHE74_00008125 [Ensete ventricosum]